MGPSNSIEDRRLLNPAYSGMLILRASQGFWKEANAGLPLVYAYLILPLILPPETRERLPHAVVTKLLSWSERNGELVAVLPRRVSELAPATRDGLFLLSTAGLANLGINGCIEPLMSEKAVADFEIQSGSTEVTDCLKRAKFVGRWLSTSGSIPTVLTVLGVHVP